MKNQRVLDIYLRLLNNRLTIKCQVKNKKF